MTKEQISTISFNQAIKGASNSERNLLLGNGFSRSIYKNFDYQELYEVAKTKLNDDKKLSGSLISIFDELETTDFEKVLAHLVISEKITKHYENEVMSNAIKSDLINIRNSFIDSLVYTHPLTSSIITDDTKNKVHVILSNFSQIFTSNYDLLLYWICMSTKPYNFNEALLSYISKLLEFIKVCDKIDNLR